MLLADGSSVWDAVGVVVQAAAGLATCFAALVGPLVGVWIAHSLIRFDAVRRDANAAFRQALENLLKYRLALLNVAAAHLPVREAETMLFRQPEWTDYAVYQEDKDRAVAKAQARLEESREEVRKIEAALNADSMTMTMLFGEEASKRCLKAYDKFLRYGKFVMEQGTDTASLRLSIEDGIRDISTCLRDMNAAMSKSDPLSLSSVYQRIRPRWQWRSWKLWKR